MGSVLTQGPLEGRRLLAQRVELEQAEVFVDPLLHHPALTCFGGVAQHLLFPGLVGLQQKLLKNWSRSSPCKV